MVEQHEDEKLQLRKVEGWLEQTGTVTKNNSDMERILWWKRRDTRASQEAPPCLWRTRETQRTTCQKKHRAQRAMGGEELCVDG